MKRNQREEGGKGIQAQKRECKDPDGPKEKVSTSETGSIGRGLRSQGKARQESKWESDVISLCFRTITVTAGVGDRARVAADRQDNDVFISFLLNDIDEDFGFRRGLKIAGSDWKSLEE